MTHGYLGLLAFDLTVLAIGYAALYGLGIVRSRRLALRGVALAFFTGWALLGVCLTTALVCGLRFGLVSILVASVLLIAACIGVRRFFPALGRAPVADSGEPLLQGLIVVGAGVIVLALVAAFVTGLRADADASYDLYAFWLLKAKAIYFFHGVSTAPSGTGTYVHPNYPLLMPTLTATSFQFMGGARTLLLPLQQSILPMAFFGSIATLLSSHVPRWITYPSLAMLVVAPGFSYRIIFVLPDLNLAFLFVLAAVASILWIEEQRAAWLVLATLFLAAAVLTKAEAEGWAIMLIVAVVGAAVAIHGRRGLHTGVLLIGLTLLEPWRIWLTSHDLSTEPTDYSWHSLFRPHYLAEHFSRFRYGLSALVHWVFDGNSWLLIPAFLVATLALVGARKPALSIAVTGWLVGVFSSIAVVFWIATPNVQAYVAESVTRITEVLPIAAAALAPLLLGLALERRAGTPPSPRAEAGRAGSE